MFLLPGHRLSFNYCQLTSILSVPEVKIHIPNNFLQHFLAFTLSMHFVLKFMQISFILVNHYLSNGSVPKHTLLEFTLSNAT